MAFFFHLKLLDLYLKSTLVLLKIIFPQYLIMKIFKSSEKFEEMHIESL